MASNAFWQEGSGSPIFFSPIECCLLVDVTLMTSSRNTSSSWTLSHGLSFIFLQWGTRKVHSGHAPIVRSPKMNLPWKHTFPQKYKIVITFHQHQVVIQNHFWESIIHFFDKISKLDNCTLEIPAKTFCVGVKERQWSAKKNWSFCDVMLVSKWH